VGFSEVLLVLVLVLVFFGSKELPKFIREAARMLGKVRRYSDKIRRELDDLTRQEEAPKPEFEEATKKKKLQRATCMAARKALSPEEREQKSLKIYNLLIETPQFAKARGVMLYYSIGSEVQTVAIIQKAIALGKRIVLPYCKSYPEDLGIAAINDLAADLQKSAKGLWEPVEALRDNFFRSDLQLIVCPGVGFDNQGKRVGRGKGYYDRFLRDFKGRIPIFGLAFGCQIIKEEGVPFTYHDVSVDQIITEDGLVIVKEQELIAPSG
jgi:5-formyltetrahydrofolate cyclo-ligase